MTHVYWGQFQITVDGVKKAFAWAFESEAPSLDALGEALRRDGIIQANRLYLTADGRGGSLIRRREPVIIGREGVVHIQNYFRQVWEPES